MVTITCGNGWGIGTNIYENFTSYGFPEVENPHMFQPDFELCTEAEKMAWMKAKEDWNTKKDNPLLHLNKKAGRF